MTMTKEEFKTSIVDGIKAGRLDPCNEEGFGDSYPDFLPYYWTVEGDQVVEEFKEVQQWLAKRKEEGGK